MRSIYYIGFYGDDLAYKENREIRPAGVNKMDYIIRVIDNIGLKVKVISPAWLVYKKDVGIIFRWPRKFLLYKNSDCILPVSLALPFRASKLISRYISKVWLLIYVLFNVRKSDKVIVYNSPFYFSIIYYLKRIIKFDLIMEVEEIYSIVFSMGSNLYKRELRLINSADSYIFPNDLMYNYLGIRKKKRLVLYGPYLVGDKKDVSFDFADEKIHLVYAGIIDKIKNGAFNAAGAAKYLPDNYVIHILGFGSEDDIRDLEREILEINTYSVCKVIYEGKKTGLDYVSFLSACQIGLSTQKSEGEYLKLTFPSKVFGYLSMGLNVISSDIEVVSISSVRDLIAYYDGDSGEKIAEAIKGMRIIDSETIRNRIRVLNVDFQEELRKLLFDGIN